MSTTEQQRLIARLWASTKRKKREMGLVEVADDIEQLQKELGGLGHVAERVGISTGMLQKFLAVRKLTGPVLRLVRQRRIDQVSVVYLLSRFSPSDQVALANEVVSGRLSGRDLKILPTLRKAYPTAPIQDVIQKCVDSNNIRAYLIEFAADGKTGSADDIHATLRSLVGESNIISIERDYSKGNIRLTKHGTQMLRHAARNAKSSWAAFVSRIIHS